MNRLGHVAKLDYDTFAQEAVTLREGEKCEVWNVSRLTPTCRTRSRLRVLHKEKALCRTVGCLHLPTNDSQDKL